MLSSPQSQVYDLYIPAPADLTREQAYTYHVSTRNFFAHLMDQALVGEKLGLAMVDLWQRIKEWQPKENATAQLMTYCDRQGYLSLADNVTHATAILTFAEKAQIRELWTDAFVHCVGMYDRLNLSREYPEFSSITKALITRASLELDLHMSRATRAIGCFLEEELGADRLGLSKPARNHLDRFRGFLHSYYLEQLGYFPPDSSEPYNKNLWTNLHKDFESLYELLADTTSDMSIHNDSNASGGICCLQNTQAFDTRHGCTALPHPCPLLPAVDPLKRATDTQRSLRSLRLGRSTSTLSEVKLPPRRALAEATNSIPEDTSNRHIIAEYRRFEKLRMEEKITVQEARKVRWLLIYGALQILNSITRAPKGVKDVESASYPLCVLTNGSPEWHNEGIDTANSDDANTKDLLDLEFNTPLPLTPENEVPTDSDSHFSIRPDCEADNAADYFSSSRRSSVNASDLTPPPLRVMRPTRTASIRMSVSSSVDVLQRSFSMARRNSSRKLVQASRPVRTNSYEVVGQGYGDITQKRVIARDPTDDVMAVAVPADTGIKHGLFQEFDFGLPNVGEEPTLNDRHLDSILTLDTTSGSDRLHLITGSEPALDLESLAEVDENTPGNRNSWIIGESAFTARWPGFDDPASATTSGSEPNSLRSSYHGDRDECDTPVSIYSPSQSPRSSKRGSVDFEKARSHQSNRPRHISMVGARGDFSPKACLSAGCYRPSGLPGQSSFTPALSKFASPQTIGTAATTPDVGSTASSIYHIGGQQADDREAESIRGRGRTRLADDLGGFSFDG